jgi:hypothetical protein
VVSLAGRAFFKSHLHNGQRVATEKTMRPNATHPVLGQTLILDLQAPRKSARIFPACQLGGSELDISTKLNNLTNVFSFAANQFFF